MLVPGQINKSHYPVVKNILSKCTNIKAMYLWGISVPGKYFLVSIADLLPELQQICFNTNCKQEHQRMFKYLKSFRNLKQFISNKTQAQMNDQNLFKADSACILFLPDSDVIKKGHVYLPRNFPPKPAHLSSNQQVYQKKQPKLNTN